MSSTKDIKSIYPSTVEKFLNAPHWRVVKREEVKGTYYEENIGRLFAVIDQNLPFRKARSLKRKLNRARTAEERTKFYFRMERMDEEETHW